MVNPARNVREDIGREVMAADVQAVVQAIDDKLFIEIQYFLISLA